jgi:hypothetical protein
MKIRLPGAFATITGAALLLSAAASPSRSAENGASESDWASPLAAVLAPGALTPKASAGIPAAVPAGKALTGRAQMMLMKGLQLTNGAKKSQFTADAVPQLQYYGGPMLANVKIQLVYWNSDVANQDKLPGFFSAITQSAYFDWLTEYNTPAVTLGRRAPGSLHGLRAEPERTDRGRGHSDRAEQPDR